MMAVERPEHGLVDELEWGIGGLMCCLCVCLIGHGCIDQARRAL